MILTVYDILKPAFRIAGLLGAPQRGLSPEEQTEGLEVLNAMLDAWKANRCFSYATLRYLLNTVADKASYTIGVSRDSTATAADIAIERPAKIERASYIFTNSTPEVEKPIPVLNAREWQAVPVKTITSSAITALYYEPFMEYGVIHPYPIPTVTGKIAIYIWTMLAELAAVTTEMILPPAYRLAIEYNLAVQLAERYPERQKIAGTSVQRARDTLATVKRLNAPSTERECDAYTLGESGRGRYDFRTDSIR
jgi:hypothetical protein